MISKLVRLGPALMKLNNYNGIMEIVSALHSAPISRLKEMWAAVTPADQQQVRPLRLTELPDAKTDGPYVPFVQLQVVPGGNLQR